MIEEHVPDEGEFHEGPADPDAPSFPEGWTKVGATTEPVELQLGNRLLDAAAKRMTLGPARIFTQPVESPVFEAIDRASEDRTPVIETKVTIDYSEAAEAFFGATQAVKGFTKTVESATWTMETIRDLYAGIEPARPQVALIGSGHRRHVHPGHWESNAEKRVEHARARRLYSERLRRDRRRVRKGRAPILRSSAFQMLIPNAQINVRKAGAEYLGMEIVAHPWVPEDQVYIVNPSILDGYRFTEPKAFDFGEAERRIERYRNQASLYGYGYRPTGRFRTTNYFRQMLNAYGDEPSDWLGHTADLIGVNETADWAPEHGPDEDRWVNEGGADRG